MTILPPYATDLCPHLGGVVDFNVDVLTFAGGIIPQLGIDDKEMWMRGNKAWKGCTLAVCRIDIDFPTVPY
jgi:hypothetical protein